jgi:Spy/CpxP family protein refolding chaperone
MTRIAKTLMGVAAGVAVILTVPLMAAGPDALKGRNKDHKPAREGRGPGLFRGQAGDINTTRIVNMLDRRLDLTDEQEKQIRGILDETKAEMKAQAEEMRGKLRASREGIEKVLTEEQRNKLGKGAGALLRGLNGFAEDQGPAVRDHREAPGAEFRMRAAMAALDLSEEQREKLRAHHEAMRAKHEALRKEMEPKIEALREEAKKELESILTPEQREQLKNRLEQMPGGPAAGPRWGAGGPQQRWRDREGGPFARPDGHEGRGFRGWGRGPRPGPPAGAPDGPPPPPPPPDGGAE